MLVIYKKELKSYFRTMVGWLFLAFNLFFSGWYFRYYGLISGYPYISYVLYGIIFMFVCSIPIITMKSFAEETKQKTDQLLYTSPISIWKIIIGKYLALCTLLLVFTVIMGFYPVVLGRYGDVPTSQNILGLVGFMLFGMACIAIGVLLSSVTDNQIIAAVLTIATLMISIMITGICNLISTTGNILTKILGTFDLYSYMGYTLYGMLYLPAILYYISVIIISLYLTGFVIKKKRWSVSSHGIKKLLSTTIGTVTVIGLVVVVNVVANLMPKQYTLKDLTYNGSHSVTAKTKDFLKKLDKDVTIYVLCDGELQDDVLKSTLDIMDEVSSHIDVEYISPSENPSFYKKYTDSMPTDNSIIVTCGDKSRVLDYFNLYEVKYDYSVNEATGEYIATSYSFTGYDGEGQIVSAIDYVANGTNNKIYSVVGHDELVPEEKLANLIQKDNYEYEAINLINYKSIPNDCDCLFMLGPLVDYTESEIKMIKDYLARGGEAVIVVAYTDSDELNNYYTLLDEYGLKVEPGLVIEQGTSYYESLQYYLLPEIVKCSVTESVYTAGRTKYVYMPYAKGIIKTDNVNDSSLIYQELLRTTENAYISEGTVDSKGKDTRQYILGVMAAKGEGEKLSKIAVYSSDCLIWQQSDELVYGNNYTIFMNSVDQVLSKDNKISVPVKKFDKYPAIMISENVRIIYSIVFICVIPLAIILTGIFSIMIRKRI